MGPTLAQINLHRGRDSKKSSKLTGYLPPAVCGTSFPHQASQPREIALVGKPRSVPRSLVEGREDLPDKS